MQIPSLPPLPATKPLQPVHSDVHGPVKVPTHQGYRYWVTFIDDFSCFKAVYLLKQKSGTFAMLPSSSSKLGLRMSLE
jgi:hypothetical protein